MIEIIFLICAVKTIQDTDKSIYAILMTLLDYKHDYF
jgi:hypothetical protein